MPADAQVAIPAAPERRPPAWWPAAPGPVPGAEGPGQALGPDGGRRTSRCPGTCYLKSLLPGGEGCVDPPPQVLLGQVYGAGGGIEFGDEPASVGAPQAELVHGLDSDACVINTIVEVGEHAFDYAGWPGLDQAAQLVNHRGQSIERVCGLPLGYREIVAEVLVVKMPIHRQAPAQVTLLKDHGGSRTTTTFKTSRERCQERAPRLRVAATQ